MAFLLHRGEDVKLRQAFIHSRTITQTHRDIKIVKLQHATRSNQNGKVVIEFVNDKLIVLAVLCKS